MGRGREGRASKGQGQGEGQGYLKSDLKKLLMSGKKKKVVEVKTAKKEKEKEVVNAEGSWMFEDFGKQLEFYKLVSIGSKEKVKCWRFKGAVGRGEGGAESLGGGLDNPIIILDSVDGGNVALGMGNASSKFEIFQV